MDKEHFTKLIPLYLDSMLDSQERKEFESFLKANPDFADEIKSYEKTWDLLKNQEEIKPDPNYVGRFWSKVANEMPWYEKTLLNVQQYFTQPRLAPAFATALMLIVGLIAVLNYTHLKQGEILMASDIVDDAEFIENIELAENLEILEDLELLEDLEILENWDSLNVS